MSQVFVSFHIQPNAFLYLIFTVLLKCPVQTPSTFLSSIYYKFLKLSYLMYAKKTLLLMKDFLFSSVFEFHSFKKRNVYSPASFDVK